MTETVKQNYKILSLVDGRNPSDNNGCPLYHTRIVPAEEAHEALLHDFKDELENYGGSEQAVEWGCGVEVDGEETFTEDGEEVDWITRIENMTLAEIEERVGHKPTTYSIRDTDYDRITHTLTDIT